MSQTAQLAQLLGVGQFAKILYNDKWRIGIVESKKVGPSGDVLTLKLDNAEGYRSLSVNKIEMILVAPRNEAPERGLAETPPTCEVCGRPLSWGHCEECNETPRQTLVEYLHETCETD